MKPPGIGGESADTADGQEITVELCAAWPGRVLRQTINVPQGTSLQDLRHHPEMWPALQQAWANAAGVSVFGEQRPARAPLADGDRVELLRPLQADPKEARRQRAKAGLSKPKGARKAGGSV